MGKLVNPLKNSRKIQTVENINKTFQDMKMEIKTVKKTQRGNSGSENFRNANRKFTNKTSTREYKRRNRESKALVKEIDK